MRTFFSCPELEDGVKEAMDTEGGGSRALVVVPADPSEGASREGRFPDSSWSLPSYPNVGAALWAARTFTIRAPVPQ